MQPAELLIIAGSAAGTVLISNPPKVLKGIVRGLVGVFTGSPYNAKCYLDTLLFLYAFFQDSRKNGLASLEAQLDEPAKSELFKKHPVIMKNPTALQFFCDTFRTIATGGVGHHDLDQIMEADLEVLDASARQPAAALTTMSDSLPGLGIVAAVLGIVITMGALGGPPEEIGHKVGAALVGTFLGVLLCYGFVGPIALNITKQAEAQAEYFQCIRLASLAFVKGSPPILSVEAARRVIPHDLRPTFLEMDKACRKRGAEAPTVGAAA